MEELLKAAFAGFTFFVILSLWEFSRANTDKVGDE